MTIDCHEWCGPPQIYTRNDNSGLWNVKPAFSPDSPLLSFRLIHGVSLHSSDHKTMEDDTHQCVVLDQLDSLNSSGTVPDEPITETLTDKGEDSRDFGGVADATATSSMAERVIEPTLVMVEVHVPWFFGIDGVHSWHFTGTGVIIYQSPSMGLVAVDRNIVAVSACDVMLSFTAYPINSRRGNALSYSYVKIIYKSTDALICILAFYRLCFSTQCIILH